MILGKNRAECERVKPSVEKAIQELGVDLSIRFITDEKERYAYGIVTTPAIVVANYKIKAEGSVPSVTIIKEWIKDIL